MKLITYTNHKSKLLDIKVDKQKNVYNFGADNAYPSLVEVLISMSPTAKRCVDEVTKAIYGKGFEVNGQAIANNQYQSFNKVFRIAARDYAKQNNAYIHVSYNANLEISQIKAVKTKDIRIWKQDDSGYSSMYVYSNNWDKSKSKAEESGEIKYYAFNPDPDVVASQIEKAGSISQYTGQIIHIQKDETNVYALSDIDEVKEDAVCEGNSKMFRMLGSEKGFLNSKLMVVPPFPDDESRDEFKRNMQQLQGAENTGGVNILEMYNVSEDVTKQYSLSDLTSDFNDKLFEYTDQQSERNICKAFSVPPLLINQADSSLFGSSGELIKQAKIQLWESQGEARMAFEEVFTIIVSLFDDSKVQKTEMLIVSPYEDVQEATIEQTPEEVNAESQAKLRGSVGGVNAIVNVQTQVAQGVISKEAGVATIVNLYGFSEEVANDMLTGV